MTFRTYKLPDGAYSTAPVPGDVPVSYSASWVVTDEQAALIADGADIREVGAELVIMPYPESMAAEAEPVQGGEGAAPESGAEQGEV